jgi:hypothetical protein
MITYFLYPQDAIQYCVPIFSSQLLKCKFQIFVKFVLGAGVLTIVGEYLGWHSAFSQIMYVVL